MDSSALWQRFRRCLCRVPALGLSLDISRMKFGGLGIPEATESIYLLLEHLASNGRVRMAGPSEPPAPQRFSSNDRNRHEVLVIDIGGTNVKMLASGQGIPRRCCDVSPTQLGRYRILGRVGAGGMGTVYRADDPQLGRVIAIKVPHLDRRNRAAAVARFLREARTAAQVRHPNVCPKDGLVYTQMLVLDIPSAKPGNFQYPHILEYDGFLWIAYSKDKATIEMLRVALSDLDPFVPGQQKK